MTTATFQVIFDGKSLSNHEIGVRELSAALASFGKLFEEADNLLNKGKTNHTLKVKGSFKTGSFKMDFVSWQNLLQKTTDIFSTQNIVTADSISNFLIFGGGGVSLWKLLKWLKGKKPTKIVENDDGSYAVYKGDKYIKAEQKVIELYQDYKVRKATEEAISDTLQEEGITEIIFTKDKGETFTQIEYKDKPYFVSLPETESEIDKQTFETNIHLVRISFKEGNKWTVDDGNSQYSVLMEDEEYLVKIEKNEVHFSRGDILKVKIRYIQYLTEVGLKKEYFIEKVLEHIEARPSIQIQMDIDENT